MANDDCCAVPVGALEHPCPVCAQRGLRVGWQTVAALVRGVLAPRQEFCLCRNAACPLAYFGGDGARILASALHSPPGFKEGGDLVCYCFLVGQRDLELEILETGTTHVPELIAARVKEGGCACEVRNPAGKCCLGEVRSKVRELTAALPAR